MMCVDKTSCTSNRVLVAENIKTLVKRLRHGTFENVVGFAVNYPTDLDKFRQKSCIPTGSEKRVLRKAVFRGFCIDALEASTKALERYVRCTFEVSTEACERYVRGIYRST